MTVSQAFLRYLTTGGDETGTFDMAGDYSAVSTLFYAKAPPGTVVEMSEVNIVIADNSTFNLADYGGIGGGILNGIGIQIRQNGVIFNGPFKPRFNWQFLTFGSATLSSFAGTSQCLVVKGLFADSFKAPIILDGDNEDYYGVVVNDNLSTLVGQLASIRGGLRLKT